MKSWYVVKGDDRKTRSPRDLILHATNVNRLTTFGLVSPCDGRNAHVPSSQDTSEVTSAHCRLHPSGGFARHLPRLALHHEICFLRLHYYKLGQANASVWITDGPPAIS